ncbi:MAG: glycosyltransferase family 2 protein [Flavobacteriaceae bacterium]
MTGQAPIVTVGVPVYRGTAFVAETLASILAQRDVRFAVRICVDGGDEFSAAACAPFLRDPRVSLEVSPSRLGWVKNTAAVLEAACKTGAAYAVIHPQDDLMKPFYLATLLSVAESEGSVVTFSDIQAFGEREALLHQDSVRGSPFERQMALLTGHYNAVAFRGLTRTDALRSLPGIAGNSVGDFAADTVWMARLARAGELRRVPEVLYLKRYHGANTHTAWARWPVEMKLAAWAQHCVDMFCEALHVAESRDQRSRLYAAAVARLLHTGTPVGPYHGELASLSKAGRRGLRLRFETRLLKRRLAGGRS